jgi:hypothetical protein
LRQFRVGRAQPRWATPLRTFFRQELIFTQIGEYEKSQTPSSIS